MIETKADFARRCGVSRQCVNGWIKAGKIDGEALVRQGANILVDVAKARAQLSDRLDSGQRFGNGLGTKLDTVEAEPSRPAESDGERDEAAETDPPGGKRDPIDRRIKRERLARLRRENRAGDEDEAARQGRYVDADEARAEMAKIAARVVRVFEGAIPEIAAEVAKACNVPERDVVLALSDAFRRVRAAEADRARKAAAALPKLKPQSPADPAPPSDPEV